MFLVLVRRIAAWEMQVELVKVNVEGAELLLAHKAWKASVKSARDPSAAEVADHR